MTADLTHITAFRFLCLFAQKCKLILHTFPEGKQKTYLCKDLNLQYQFFQVNLTYFLCKDMLTANQSCKTSKNFKCRKTKSILHTFNADKPKDNPAQRVDLILSVFATQSYILSLRVQNRYAPVLQMLFALCKIK